MATTAAEAHHRPFREMAPPGCPRSAAYCAPPPILCQFLRFTLPAVSPVICATNVHNQSVREPHGCLSSRLHLAPFPTPGALTGHSHEDEWMAYVAYKLSLAAVPHFFPQGASNHWNTNYPKARQVRF